jgi:2'-5' RNA ligase
MQYLGLAPAAEYDLDAALAVAEAKTAAPRARGRAGFEYGIPDNGLNEWTASVQALDADRRTLLGELYEAYTKCPWAWAGVNAVARRVTAGALEFVYDPDEDASGDDEQPKKPAEVVACERLFRYVNEREDIRQLLRGVVTDLLVFGDAFVEVVWVGKVPVALYSLPSREMTPKADRHGQITGYVQLTDFGQKAVFEPRQVVHISLDSPMSGVFGIAPLQAALVPIERWLFTAATQLQTYRKGDPLTVHADLPADMTGPDIRRWIGQVMARNIGPANIGYPWVTKGGGTLKELGTRRIESQNTVLDKARDEILAALGVPPAKAGVIESGNLGSGTDEGQDKTFELQTCDPIAAAVLDKIQFHVAERGFGIEDWRLHFAEVDTRDSKTIEQIRVDRLKHGVWTLNRYRAEIGEPPVDGGDQAILMIGQGSVIRMRDVDASAKAEIASKVQGTSLEIGEPGDEDTPVTLVKAAKPEPSTPVPPIDPAAPPAAGDDPAWDQAYDEEQPTESATVPAEKTGGMVALLPDAATAARLAAAGGLPVAELHLTLAYLGDVTGWPDDNRAELVEAMRDLAARCAPVDGRVLARTVFNEDGGPDGQEPCAVYLIGDTPGLGQLLDEVRDDVENREGVPAQREPFVAHVTGGYGLTVDQLPGTGDVRFDRLVVALAGEWTEIPLDPKVPGVPTHLGEALEAELAADGVTAYVDELGGLWLWDVTETRYVRSAAGSRRYGVPIGAAIPAGRKKRPTRSRSVGKPDTARVKLTAAQQTLAADLFSGDDSGAQVSSKTMLSVSNPKAAAATLDRMLEGDDLTAGRRRTVRALRRKIGTLLDLDRAEDDGGTVDGGAPETAAARQQIRDVYASAVSPGDWLGMVQLRALLTGLSREEQDAALTDLALEPGVHVQQEPNQKALTPADHAARVLIGGDHRDMLMIEEPDPEGMVWDPMDGWVPADKASAESHAETEEAATSPTAGEWPGWQHDEAIADHYAQAIVDDVTAEMGDVADLAAAWLASDESRTTEEVAPLVAAVVAAAAAWLAARAVRFAARLVPRVQDAMAEGYLIGERSARAVLTVSDPVWDEWTPGDPDAARKILGDDGSGSGLQDLLDDSDVRLTGIADDRMTAFAQLLARAVAEGWSVDQLAQKLLEFRDDWNWAYVTAQTELARTISAATLDTYIDHDVDRHEWLVAGEDPEDRIRVCPICTANAADGPVEVGANFPSGHPHPPAHPRCRCALMPVIDIEESGDWEWSVEEARYVRTAAGARKYGLPIGSLIKPNPKRTSKGAAAIARTSGVVRPSGVGGEHGTSTDADRVRRKTLTKAVARADKVRPYDADPGSHIAAAMQRALAGRKPVYIHSAGARTVSSLRAPEPGGAQFLIRPNGTVWRRSFTRQGEERLQQVADDRVLALVAPHVGMGGQPIPRPAINPRSAARDPKALDDLDLEEAMQAAITEDDLAAFDKLAAESDRRDAGRQERQRRSEAAEQRKAEEYERLITRGYADEEAIAAAYGVSVEKQRRTAALAVLRGQGYQGRSLEESARAAFRDEVYEHYMRAENDIGMSMLTKKAQADGIDERTLFVGNEDTARKHASDELLAWWDEHGRPTYDEFLAGLLDDPQSASRTRNGRSDFLR